MRATLRSFPALGLAILIVGLGPAPASGAEGRWLAGDLHAHTTYSHDSYGGPDDDNTGHEEAYTVGHTVSSQFAVAASRGLDYLAVTDHNDVRSQSDPGFGSGGVIGVPGYENSLEGHAQMLGATELIGSGSGAAEVEAAAATLRAAPYNGVFQINHPAEGSTAFPDDIDWQLGHQVVPDTVEVWNISRLYQPPLPSASSNDDAVHFWEGFLDRGEHVAATGGSDNHYLATTPIQGVGQPTTWVYAEERSLAGLLRGLRQGHTFVSHQPPNLGGPRLFLEADEDGDGAFEAIVGDTVRFPDSLRVRVSGAPGTMLRLVGNGGEQLGEPVPVTGSEFEHHFAVEEAKGWVRAEIFSPDGSAERERSCDQILGDETTYCRGSLGVLAMTSALFLEPKPTPAGHGPPSPATDPALSDPDEAAGPLQAPAPPPPDCERGTKRDDRLGGTPGDDCLEAGRGDDRLGGRAGDDRLLGGAGEDRMIAGPGVDIVNCGAGEDFARVDELDRARGCESVRGA